MTTYAEFLDRKRHLGGQHGFEPNHVPDWLFPFQRHLVEWAVRRGRGAIFADCGLGKTPMALTWADNVMQHAWRPVLIVTPLAVAEQIVTEAERFGFPAAVSRDGRITAPITVTNYERLERFDRTQFAGLVCDESSAIKAFDGSRRALVTDWMRKLPYRLLATATAAPNDYVELGTSSEALGELGAMDLINYFFVNDQNNSATKRNHGQAPKFRFKGWAEVPFWRYVSSWARAIRRPSDYGFADDGFVLPQLVQRQHVVAQDYALPESWPGLAVGLAAEREEARATLVPRCEAAAGLLDGPEPGIAWCHLNDESSFLTSLIDGAVEVRGSDPAEKKEEALAAFSRGEIRVLVTKPTIAGWGLNWQHCARMTYFPSHSYEAYYQSVRRCWRFGQTRDVEVHVVTTPGAARALENLERKAAQADAMFDRLVEHMRDALTIDPGREFPYPVQLPDFLTPREEVPACA